MLVSLVAPTVAEAVAGLARSARFRIEQVSSRLKSVSSNISSSFSGGSNLQSNFVNLVPPCGASPSLRGVLCR